MSASLNLNKIKKIQRAFAKEREWERFHTPKNLSMALVGEAAELLEVFFWLTEEESSLVTRNRKKKKNIEDELADVLYYLVRLSDVMDVDLEKAFWNKMKQNRRKYPAHKARGNAKKYNEL